jgi:hypothetical protein
VTISRLSRLNQNPRSRSAGRLPVAALAVAAVLAAGCGASSPGSSGSRATASPQQAVEAAARQAAQISSATAVLSEQAGGSGGESISGAVTEQIKPSLLMSMRLSISSGSGASEYLGGIINTRAMYLRSSAFGQQTGKPWLEIPFSVLGGASSSLAQLFKSLSKINPAQQTAVLGGARNVRDAGTAVIDGAATTHYTGTISPSNGLAALPPALRKTLAPELKAISGHIAFGLWIDRQNQIRKVTESETVSGEPVITTIVFSAINQPVHVSLPPASQVSVIPASVLSGGTD